MANQRTPLRPGDFSTVPSGSPLAITATASPGTVVHQIQPRLHEEVHLWATLAGQNGTATLEILTPGRVVAAPVAGGDVPVKLLDGLAFYGPGTLRVFTDVPDCAVVFGYVVRNTKRRPLQAVDRQAGSGEPVLLTSTLQVVHTLRRGSLDELHLWAFNPTGGGVLCTVATHDSPARLFNDFVAAGSGVKIVDGAVFRGPGTITASGLGLVLYGYFVRR